MIFELGVTCAIPNNMNYFSIESSVRGYQIYKEIGNLNVKEQLPRQCENGNCADQFR